jgi:hypothetical protein
MKLLIGLVIAAWTGSALAALPAGPTPVPLELPHFPSRVHAVVFRNWNLVETARLARVLGTTPENVTGLAESMGLPPARAVPPEFRHRLYISLIKRNWHLLPYEQLLTLLDMNEEQLAQTLWEDDFLWSKLGSLKPKCEPVTYSPPTDEQRRRASEIRAQVEMHFPDSRRLPAEAPLAFLARFDKPIADADVRPSRAAATGELRFLYSYCAVYGDPLLDPSLNPLPDGLLQRYADLGVTGVWLHVVLRDLAPPTDAFPEFGNGHETRLANLAKLAARAERFGIGIYLYLNEPRAMPAEFFDRPGRGDIRGVREGDHFAMCTSSPVVRQWLASSLSQVFTKVPDLGGVFTITASENFTNCASHNNHKGCPRCKDRSAAEILAEVNATIEAAVHAAAPKANVIAWDWGWPDAVAPAVIRRLPDRDNTWLMSVSEWSLPIERGGIRGEVGEYSISSVGPGPRALRHWAAARARGRLKTVAKIACNNTWELSAVPYLPAMDLVAEHAGNLAKADVDGLMMSWTLGGYPSPNLEVFGRLARKDAPSRDAVLDEVARRTFGDGGARHARKAWSIYSQAFGEFPYDGAVVYNAPLQTGPANLLYVQRTGYHATMVGFPYDDLEHWRGRYPAGVFIAQMEKVATGFADAERHLEQAVRASGGREDAADQLRLARAARLHFASVAAQARFVQLRDSMARADMTAEARRSAIQRLRLLVTADAEHAKALYELQRQDSRIGFEASNHYYYLPQDLVEKHLNCERLLSQLK